ncbi:replication protein A 32 kDa subunit B-like isoform X1 [Silene latifolia]|uniref:replication protein A 32 kDa subunit B-like isoform X1 n=1 Tax=Silene latifolia TaxID=37657 RepID=UPI003D77D8FE
MMYGSQFDGSSAFAGGGFMPSQATQSADSSFAPSKNRDAQALVPLTVKQINEALLTSEDRSNFIVDGVDVNNVVTIVGMVFNKVERVTDIGFALDDGTGRIDVHRWVNEAYDTKETENIMDGMYIRVHANLKGFQGKRQLVAFATRPITDFNEITFHFMECIYVHFYNTRLRAATPPVDGQSMPSVNGTPFRGHQGALQNQFAGHVADLRGLDQRVFEHLNLPENLARERGVHINELVQKLNAPLEKIMESMMPLVNEGLIYSTIDEDHFKSAANA